MRKVSGTNVLCVSRRGCLEKAAVVLTVEGIFAQDCCLSAVKGKEINGSGKDFSSRGQIGKHVWS